MIRAAQEGDLEALTGIYNHYVRHTAITFDLDVFTPEARRAWMEHYAPSGPHRLLVEERDGAAVGYASSGPFRPKGAYRTSVETSIYLHPDWVGCGLGAPLYRALFEALAGEDVHRAYAGITLPNDSSLALHRRLGFRPLGTFEEVGRKFDRYWSVSWLEKKLPAPPGGGDT